MMEQLIEKCAIAIVVTLCVQGLFIQIALHRIGNKFEQLSNVVAFIYAENNVEEGSNETKNP